MPEARSSAALWCAAAIVGLLSACVQKVPVVGAPCPCGPTLVCCSSNRCAAAQTQCEGDSPPSQDAAADIAFAGEAHLDKCEGPAGPSHLRALTTWELKNSVRDVLGVSASAALAKLPAEPRAPFSTTTGLPVTTPLVVELLMDAAEDVSTSVIASLDAVFTCDAEVVGQSVCAKSFVESFGARLFRRPLDAEEIASFMTAWRTAQDDPVDAYRAGLVVALSAMLQSPQFLYLFEPGVGGSGAEQQLTSFEIAARLSFLVWGSVPDGVLTSLANEGALLTPTQISKQAARLLQDPRARGQLGRFHEEWLMLDRVLQTEAAPPDAPLFDLPLRRRVHASALRFVDHVVSELDGKLSTLLTAPFIFSDGVLSTAFDDEWAAVGTVFTKKPSQRRVGILSQPAALATSALRVQADPASRGMLVRSRLFCEDMQPPPPSELFAGTLVTRADRDALVAHPSCGDCHRLLDPVGFGFDAFDGLGRRKPESASVDSSGYLVSTDVDRPFADVGALASALASSSKVRRCVVQRFFEFAMRRTATPADSCTIDALDGAFAASGGDLRTLAQDLSRTRAFVTRTLPAGTP